MPTELEIAEFWKRKEKELKDLGMRGPVPRPETRVRIIEFPQALTIIEDKVQQALDTAQSQLQNLQERFATDLGASAEMLFAQKQDALVLNAKKEILNDMKNWIADIQTTEGASHGK